MTLSREIVVLDLTEKDPLANPADLLRPGSEQTGELADTGTYATSSSLGGRQQTGTGSGSGGKPERTTSGTSNCDGSESPEAGKHCISSHTLSLFICSIGLLFILYVWIVACLFARRDSKISHIKQQFYWLIYSKFYSTNTNQSLFI